MPAFAIARFAAQLAAGLGAGKIVAGIVRTNVPIVTRPQMVTVWMGAFALGGIAMEHAADYTGKMADQAVEIYTKIKNRETTDSDEK